MPSLRTRTTRPLARAAVAAVAVVLLGAVASGCGLRSGSEYVPTANAGSIKAYKSLQGVKIAVGSKDFTEQLILGKMAVILLTVAGMDVTDSTNIQGSNSMRKAQESGAVPLDWEYTGTSWISYNGHTKPIADPQKQWEAVKQEDAKKGIAWLPPAPLNNTYAMAIRASKNKELKLKTLADIAKLPKSERTFCVESEFANRDDGLEGMLKAYGIPIGSGVPRNQIKNMDTGVVYTATAKGQCNFGEVFTTDGRIKGLKLDVLTDPKHFFPNYNVCVTIKQPLLKDNPDIAKVFAPVTKQLTNEEMLSLTKKVDVDGEEPADVALGWLKKKKFVT